MRTVFARSVLVMTALPVLAATASARYITPKAQTRMQRDIRHELIMLPYYGVFDHLAFRLDGYNVTLLGQVSRPTLKSDAERVVKRVEGVEQVRNQVEVLPLSPHDDRLRLAVYRAVYGHAVLNRYALGANPPIHIIVRRGDVTLEGVVANSMDRNVAGLQANGVPGVFSVTNHLLTERR